MVFRASCSAKEFKIVLEPNKLFFKAFCWQESKYVCKWGTPPPQTLPHGGGALIIISFQFRSLVGILGREKQTNHFDSYISRVVKGWKLIFKPIIESKLRGGGFKPGGMVHHSLAKGGLRRGGFSKGA